MVLNLKLEFKILNLAYLKKPLIFYLIVDLFISIKLQNVIKPEIVWVEKYRIFESTWETREVKLDEHEPSIVKQYF